MTIVPDPVADGQESVWSYPRPAVALRCPLHLEIVHLGGVVAATDRSIRTLETSHPPTYYFPPDCVRATLQPSGHRSFCEWKGQAVYFDVVIGDLTLREVAWSYPDPSPAFQMLRDHVAFYAAPFDRCSVAGETVTPQPGGFYGGWITSQVAGPFKGVPGSRFW